MHNKNVAWLAVGTIVLAFVVVGVYWPKAARNEPIPKPVVIENVAHGAIVLPETLTQFAVDGPDGLVSVELNKGVGQLPVGTYLIGAWQAERVDDQGITWTLTGRHYGSDKPFEVTEGSRTNLDVGEPIVGIVHGSRIGPKFYAFSQSLQGRLDEQIALTCNGTRPGAPKLRIKNEEGTYDRTFAFQYG
jgi:hypothetical protein